MINTKLLKYLESYVTDNRKNLFKNVLEQRTRHFTVVLENIYQPHNMSAVVRSCDIFGIQDIHTIEQNYISKVSKHVARGSQKWLTFHRELSDNASEKCFNNLKLNGYQIIATSPHTDATLYDFDVTKKTAFVFGTEKDGISDYVKENADGLLKIPMYGFTESFNISVAVAIILQDVTSRIRKTTIDWQLTDLEKQELYFYWVKKSIKNVDKLIQHYQKF